jgi:arabinogalactan oligomer/maltooligosaccharide transport system permease protein
MATVTAAPGKVSPVSAKAGEIRDKSLWQKIKDGRLAYLYIAPAAIAMAVITLYPMIFQIWMSFTTYSTRNLKATYADILTNTSPAPAYTLNNYTDIFGGLTKYGVTNYDFWRLLSFNVVWAFSNVIFHVTIGILVAMVLNRKKLFGRRLYRSLFLIPWAMPPFVVALIWRNMFNTQFGAINQLFGVQIPWLESNAADPIPFLPLLPLSYFAILITNVWLGWPFMSVVATGALQSVSPELYEAADMDGASRWQRFWNVTVPSIRPAMVPAIMLGLIWTFNQFNVIYFVSQGGPYGRTEILVTQAYKFVSEKRLYGLASAFSIIVFFILLIITLITNRITKATEGTNEN